METFVEVQALAYKEQRLADAPLKLGTIKKNTVVRETHDKFIGLY